MINKNKYKVAVFMAFSYPLRKKHPLTFAFITMLTTKLNNNVTTSINNIMANVALIFWNKAGLL